LTDIQYIKRKKLSKQLGKEREARLKDIMMETGVKDSTKVNVDLTKETLGETLGESIGES
jgi:hypothetical protein